MGYMENYEKWLASDVLDNAAKEELMSVKDERLLCYSQTESRAALVA